MKAGLIGHPVAHSKSPIIHNYWMKRYDIKGEYRLFDVRAEEIAAFIERLIEDNFDGFNVTIPHKENIIPFCKEIDGNAKQIGAVNTVHIKGGKLYGYNTDAIGFIQNIKQAVPDFDMTGKTALALGAGGAARAVIQGLKNEGIGKIFLTNRTREKSDFLQQHFGDIIEVIDWDDRESKNIQLDLLVNTTSLGMVHNPPLEFDLNGLNSHAIINDIVYNPLHTPLLQQADNKGLRVVTGIGMLLHQAAPAFELWSGVAPDITPELTELVLK